MCTKCTVLTRAEVAVDFHYNDLDVCHQPTRTQVAAQRSTLQVPRRMHSLRSSATPRFPRATSSQRRNDTTDMCVMNFA